MTFKGLRLITTERPPNMRAVIPARCDAMCHCLFGQPDLGRAEVFLLLAAAIHSPKSVRNSPSPFWIIGCVVATCCEAGLIREPGRPRRSRKRRSGDLCGRLYSGVFNSCIAVGSQRHLRRHLGATARHTPDASQKMGEILLQCSGLDRRKYSGLKFHSLLALGEGGGRTR